MVDLVTTIRIVIHHLQGGEESASMLLLFDLFIDEPVQAVHGGIVVLVLRQAHQVVDHLGDFLFVHQGLAEHFDCILPLCGDCADGFQGDRNVLREHVLLQKAGVLLLLLRLDKHPVAEAGQTVVAGMERHTEVEVSRPEFGIDLRVERRFHF